MLGGLRMLDVLRRLRVLPVIGVLMSMPRIRLGVRHAARHPMTDRLRYQVWPGNGRRRNALARTDVGAAKTGAIE